MNQVKNSIIDKINLLEDEGTINALNRILEDLNHPEIQKLKRGETELVMMGLKDLNNGKVTEDEELRNEEDSWLNG